MCQVQVEMERQRWYLSCSVPAMSSGVLTSIIHGSGGSRALGFLYTHPHARTSRIRVSGRLRFQANPIQSHPTPPQTTHTPVQRVVGPHDVGRHQPRAAQLAGAEPPAVFVFVDLGVLLRPEPEALGRPAPARRPTPAGPALLAYHRAARSSCRSGCWPKAAPAGAKGRGELEEGRAGRKQEDERERRHREGPARCCCYCCCSCLGGAGGHGNEACRGGGGGGGWS